VGRSDDEDAQLAWVYYRAATAVADRVTSKAASWSGGVVDQATGSETTLEIQIRYWVDKAAAYLLAYQDALAVLVTTTDPLGGFASVSSLRHG
jgi:hypothetical protein